jgi:NAD+ kinase
MRVGIVGYKKGKEAAETVKKFAEFLCSEGYDAVEFAVHTEITGVDVVLVLGGDGAILHSSIVAAKQGIKIIGINFGTLGFLTEYEKSEKERVKELLVAIENNACRVLKRSILQIEIGEKVYYALNEISIQRDYGLNEYQARQILSLELRCREGVDVISGDGLLVCTPTGSTAYSLSAGGAIITPEVPVFMMTPICAFSMRARPIVFSDTEEFVITSLQGKAIVLADGCAVAQIPENSRICIKKAPFTADFPVKETSGFLDKVRNKLNG